MNKFFPVLTFVLGLAVGALILNGVRPAQRAESGPGQHGVYAADQATIWVQSDAGEISKVVNFYMRDGQLVRREMRVSTPAHDAPESAQNSR